MKKIILFQILLLVVLLIPNCSFAAYAPDLNSRMLESYVDTGICEKSVLVSLSSTTTTTTIVELPDCARGFKLYPRSNDIRFLVDNTNDTRTIAHIGGASGTVTASQFAEGDFVKGNTQETRLLPTKKDGYTRRIKMISTTASTAVDVGVFN